MHCQQWALTDSSCGLQKLTRKSESYIKCWIKRKIYKFPGGSLLLGVLDFEISDLFKLQRTPLGVCKQKWRHLAAATGISKDLLQHSLGGIIGVIVPGGAESGSPS